MTFERGVLESYFLNPKASDVTVCATTSDGVSLRIPSHRLVLSSLSPVFKKMFEPDKFEEGKSRVINIQVEGGEDVARSFIRFFYYGNVQSPSLSQGLGLLKTSHLYQVDRLITRSEQMILDALTLDTVCRVYKETQALGSTSYVEKMLNLILCSAFIIFQQENHTLLSETAMYAILSSDLLNVLNENQVADALWKWGCWRCFKSGGSVSSSDIALNIRDLSCHVRWGLVTSKERYVEVETLRTLIERDPKGYNQVREPANSSSIIKFAEVFHFHETFRIVDYEDVTSDFNDKGLVLFCTDHDILLIGFELQLKTKSSNVAVIPENLILKLDDTILYLSAREIEKLNDGSHRILFESSKPILISRMNEHVLRLRTLYSAMRVKVSLYEMSKAIICKPGDSSSVHFIIQNKRSSVSKFYFFPTFTKSD